MPQDTEIGKNRETLVLLVLGRLHSRGVKNIREYELQQLVRKAQPSEMQLFRFADGPISYSFDLSGLLRSLERDHYLTQTMRIATLGGKAPTPVDYYELTHVGRAQAAEYQEWSKYKNTELTKHIEKVLDQFMTEDHQDGLEMKD